MLLKLSRRVGDSIVIGERCVLTVVGRAPDGRNVSLLVTKPSPGHAGLLAPSTVELEPGGSVPCGGDAKATLIEVRDQSVRIGVSAPPECSVHRLEVYEEIVRQGRRGPPGD